MGVLEWMNVWLDVRGRKNFFKVLFLKFYC